MTNPPPDKDRKTPEMPQEIHAVTNADNRVDVWLTFDPKRESVRYILAAPKEDVERALEDMDRPRGHSVQSQDYNDLLTYRRHKETIRRVLLANAGRKE